MIVNVFVEEKSKAEIKNTEEYECLSHLFNNQSEIIIRIFSV